MGAKKIKVEEMKFYTLKEVAAITSYHEKSLYVFIREGSLKTLKIKGKRLVTAAALRKFLESSLSDGDLEE